MVRQAVVREFPETTYELGHEGNHQVEKTNGLDEGETKNGVREELATEGGVAGNTVDEGGEDETDTDTGTGKTDGGGTHTQVLGDLNHGLGDLGRVGTLGLGVLEHAAGVGLEGDLGTGVGHAGQGALGGDLERSGTHGRASGLGGHGGGEPGGEDTSGGHCDCVGEESVDGWDDGQVLRRMRKMREAQTGLEVKEEEEKKAQGGRKSSELG